VYLISSLTTLPIELFGRTELGTRARSAAEDKRVGRNAVLPGGRGTSWHGRRRLPLALSLVLTRFAESNRESESSRGCLWGAGRTRVVGFGSPESLRESENMGFGCRGGETPRKTGPKRKTPAGRL